MKRESLVFFLGLSLMLLPFLGLPSSWKRVLFVAIGAVLALVGYQMRRRSYLRTVEDAAGERKTDVYVEQVTVSVEPDAVPVAEALTPPESEEPYRVRARRVRAPRV